MLLRKSFVAMAVWGAASEWPGAMGTIAIANQATTRELNILEGVIIAWGFKPL